MPRRKRSFSEFLESEDEGDSGQESSVGAQEPLHPLILADLSSTSHPSSLSAPSGPALLTPHPNSENIPLFEAGSSQQLEAEDLPKDNAEAEEQVPISDTSLLPITSDDSAEPSISPSAEIQGQACHVEIPSCSDEEHHKYTDDNEMICSNVSDVISEDEMDTSVCDDEEDRNSVISEDGSIFFDALSDSEDFRDFCSDMPSGEDPLHPESEVSFQMAMVALLTLVMTHRLTKECVGDLLSLLKLILPKGNILVESAYLFFSHFNQHQSTFTKHFFCRECSESVPSSDAVCPRCGSTKGADFFIQFSISDQLQKLFESPGFLDKLKHPETRVKKNETAYEDIYDGNIYKEAKRLFFCIGSWISLMWNTDGFAVFKSSTFSVWPFFLAINELPPNLRLKKENMLLGGLWCGTGKFDPNLFLKPIYEELCKLKEGFEFKIPSSINPVKFKVALLCGTCDTPAKSTFFCHTNFNGCYGCLKCLSRGLKSAESGNVFVYPFEERLSLRSNQNYERHVAATQTSNGKKVKGVKGPSYLYKMLLVSPLASTSIDIMHCCFLGVVKTLMQLWFHKGYRSSNFSLYKCTNIVDDYLGSIKPPHFLQRCPQSVKKLAFWKASEYESFFFFYSLPILCTIMDSVYFNHYMLLYEGLYLLCQESITESDIDLAQELLDKFVMQYQELYGLRHMTYNLHCLRHLPGVVRALGPLWTSTCYLFEGLNGTLKHLVHGTQHIGLQVQTYFGLATNLLKIIKLCPGGLLRDLCLKMYSPERRLNINCYINQVTCIVGPLVDKLTLEPIVQQAINNLNGTVTYFKCLRSHSCLYVVPSDSPRRKLSSHVMYSMNNTLYFGVLQVFLKVSACQCSQICDCASNYFAVIKRFDTDIAFKTVFRETPVKSVLKCSISGYLDIVDVSSLNDVCFSVNFDGNSYIVKRPYRLDLQ